MTWSLDSELILKRENRFAVEMLAFKRGAKSRSWADKGRGKSKHNLKGARNVEVGLERGAECRTCGASAVQHEPLQGYLAHKKPHPPRTLQSDYT